MIENEDKPTDEECPLCASRDVQFDKNSEDYKLLMEAYETGARVTVTRKTKAEIMAMLGRSRAPEG